MLHHTPILSILTDTEQSVADFNASILLSARKAYENREIKTVDFCPPRNLEYRELKKIPKVYSPLCLVHWPQSWGTESRGHEGVLKSILRTRNVFPDWHEEILDMIVTEEKVVTRYLSSRTDLTPLSGPC